MEWISSEELLTIVQSVMPAIIAVIGIVTSCIKVINQFKSFKQTQAADMDELRSQVNIIVAENAQLKKTCRELSQTVTKIKKE